MQEYIQLDLNRKVSNIYLRNGRWLLHLLVLSGIVLGIVFDETMKGTLAGKLFYILSTYILLFGIAFYAYCQYLIPLYFKRNRHTRFWIYLAAGLLLLPFLSLCIQALTKQYAPGNYITPMTWQGYWGEFRDSLLIFLGLSFVLYLIEVAEGRKTYKAMRREMNSLHVISQNLIRTRMDPVFVIQSLEGIARLAESRSAHAPETVVAFADVLRYRLYHGKEKAPLSQELTQVENLCLFHNSIAGSGRCSLQIVGERTGRDLPAAMLVNMVETALKTDDGTPGWSAYFYILIEADEMYLVTELPAAAASQAVFDDMLALANRFLDEDCIFTKESGEDSDSLSICIPVKRSVAW